MDDPAKASASAPDAWNGRHLAALLVGNVVLALGPWSVRLADSGPVAAGFWRLALALPFLAVLARAARQPLAGFPRAAWLAVAGAGLFFALDLASWHIGIGMTRLANVTLFGNAGSIILMIWGLIAARRLPRRGEAAACVAALAGAAILLGRSLEIGTATFHGDLLCLLAGLFYTVYILLLQGARERLGNWSILFWASLFGAPPLLAFALALGEPVWPHRWWPLIALMLGSQVVGQGLLIYALRHFSPLIIGLSLMTQPAVAVLAGWFVFDEALTGWDGVGMVLLGLALVLARTGEKG
jgi:drug/metabolite transporter (DMT)-like permease